MSQEHYDAPAEENRFHTYSTHHIPWYIRIMWVVFWVLAIYYVVKWAVPMAKTFFK
ncbi:MAG: hypothetical protein KDA33_00055 [Phycisphaerales bacterium]|nr:hypothetical protein [Phycisphaerales bacterium]